MNIKVIVFDFDGTLIDSNQVKYDAYFRLFPINKFYESIISKVLNEYFEESRYIILERILKMAGKKAGKRNLKKLANEYNTIVVSGVKQSNDKPYAVEVLNKLSAKFRLYLSSVTPEKALRDIVNQKGWEHYFAGIFGYPKAKVDTLLDIISKENIHAKEALVIGDGDSDRISAAKVGCRFFRISEKNALKELIDRKINV